MVSVLGDVHLRDTREVSPFRDFGHQHVGLALRMVDHHLVVFLRQLTAHRVKLRRAERLEETVYILALWVDGKGFLISGFHIEHITVTIVTGHRYLLERYRTAHLLSNGTLGYCLWLFATHDRIVDVLTLHDLAQHPDGIVHVMLQVLHHLRILLQLLLPVGNHRQAVTRQLGWQILTSHDDSRRQFLD